MHNNRQNLPINSQNNHTQQWNARHERHQPMVPMTADEVRTAEQGYARRRQRAIINAANSGLAQQYADFFEDTDSDNDRMHVPDQRQE
jgi:hypothetical protein